MMCSEMVVLLAHSTFLCSPCQEKSAAGRGNQSFRLTLQALPSKIQAMKQAFFLFALSGAAVCVAVADDVQSVCSAVDAGLAEQLAILSGVKDASSAAAAVAPLTANLEALQALNDKVDTTAMWRHIENTPELKQKLVLCIQKISIEYFRIEEAQFYACDEFKSLLAPLITPAVEHPVEDVEE